MRSNNKYIRVLVGIAAVIVGLFYLIRNLNSDETDPFAQHDILTQTIAEGQSSVNEDSAGQNRDNGSEISDSKNGSDAPYVAYTFRSDKLLSDHYKKHGEDMGFATKEEYEAAAARVANSPDALHKLEAEDGDDVYYIEATNEFVIVSSDGYIRTYFKPDAGIEYYNRQ